MQETRMYWITGLSGAGKTTIGAALYKRLKKQNPATVMLDGDLLRDVYGNDLGYSQEERRKGALRNARLCRMLAEQGITVICCTISMFDSVRDWNRQNIPGYTEVYLRVRPEVLRQRDQKGIYSGFEDGSVKDVVGFDIGLQEPKNPDIVIDNNGEQTVGECVSEILLYAISNLPPTSLDNLYWNEYYQKQLAEERPSLFAQFALEQLRPGERIIDLGCGNGRDSLYFARNGLQVTAMDRSTEAIAAVKAASEEIQCVVGDITRVKGAALVPYHHCYSRFSIHSLTAGQQTLMIRGAADSLVPGGRFWIEARSVRDEICGKGERVGPNEYLYGGHYRRFLVLEELVEELEANGFRVLSAEEKNGFAPYRGDDPIVIRVVAEKAGV